MSSCCSSTTCNNTVPTKQKCPVSGNTCSEVSADTITQHIQHPWKWLPGDDTYYFCADPQCDVVYFANDQRMILQSNLRTQVGVKQAGGDALLCYCYGISQDDYRLNPATRDYVIQQTKHGRCACESRNPSGRCCLKDFPDTKHTI